MTAYIIKTERLGLRNWCSTDLEPFTEMSQDEDVMSYFPKLLSKEECNDFIKRMQLHFKEFGFCYFAVDIIETGEFIGFTGMLNQNYKSNFTPCIDIGWRLKKSSWGNGYATEAAKSCLKYSANELNINKIYSLAPIPNNKSIAIMKKIGMTYDSIFHHPTLKDDDRLKECMVYKKINY
ncbi:MAG: RimJ/RimL family protein N-acetyltransferase [Flavobacteriaceae bacterium]|jgi:RimJ/RimL family protein N-acetyltransferase